MLMIYCLVILVYLWHFSCYLAEEKTMFSTAVSNLISINDTLSVDPPLTGCPKSQPKVMRIMSASQLSPDPKLNLSTFHRIQFAPG